MILYPVIIFITVSISHGSAGCRLLNVTQCESSSNPPVNCPSSTSYQPPLPREVTIDGTYYSNQLTSSDIDCTSDVWSAAGTCTETFCDRLSSAESQVSYVMSIPYLISAACSPPMARDYYSTDARNE